MVYEISGSSSSVVVVSAVRGFYVAYVGINFPTFQGNQAIASSMTKLSKASWKNLLSQKFVTNCQHALRNIIEERSPPVFGLFKVLHSSCTWSLGKNREAL
jgi:hypothetical protein